MGAPLHGVRILDLTDGLGESCGRYLADLGAEVVRVEPRSGARSRTAEPVIDGVGIPFALRNAGKLGVALDLSRDADRARFDELAVSADILVRSGTADNPALDPKRLARRNPRLVQVLVSGFGATGPYRGWQVTENVLYAMSGVLSRSGPKEGPPVLPPAGLVEETIGMHAAWSALLAHLQRQRTGCGDVVDLAGLEAVVHGFDPGFGTQGSAAAGRSEDFARGRPDASNFYPVFPCADGQVRICLLAKRQWRAMFEWLGRPPRFADPRYDTIAARFRAADILHPLIAELFAPRTREELVAEGVQRGIPIAGVHTLSEVLEVPHFTIHGSLVDAEIAPGLSARIPSGYAVIDGVRAGFRGRAPGIGEHDAAVPDRAPLRSIDMPEAAAGSRPLEDVRILDLGVIVFGAELSRQFADYGADVIKVETSAFPDGLRQSRRGGTLAASVAWGHRNKRSLGLDLRRPEGLRIFRRLVAQSDVVLANFKPGTLASLGLSPEELAELNPGLVVCESSAFGSTGPWRGRLGYGPLVRASTGVSSLWRRPEATDEPGDGATVYPDHIAAHVAAVAVLAALIRRRTSGRGTAIEVAQADTALVQLGPQLVAESLRRGSATAPDDRPAPSGVFPCAGDDEWCVVEVRDDTDWVRLCRAVGRPELGSHPNLATRSARRANRAAADEVVRSWTATRTPTEVMKTLQAAGVPAGAMLRLPDLLTDPQLAARGAFSTLEHDLLPATLPTVAHVGRFHEIPAPELRQAPLPGQQTREICRGLLGMSESEIDELIDQGVIEATQPARQDHGADHPARQTARSAAR